MIDQSSQFFALIVKLLKFFVTNRKKSIELKDNRPLFVVCLIFRCMAVCLIVGCLDNCYVSAWLSAI